MVRIKKQKPRQKRDFSSPSAAAFRVRMGKSPNVLPRGFEPPAKSLGNFCSIHLSYGSLLRKHLFSAGVDRPLKVADVLDDDFVVKQFNFSEVGQMCQ